MIVIRRGTAADAGALAELAETTFRDAFAQENRPEDMALYVSRVYGVAQQRAELENPSITTLMGLVDNQLVAYAQVRMGEPAPWVPPGDSLELWRFYVHRDWHGRGIAKALMDAVVSAAREQGARTLWLGVWERNARAQAFYRKSGFQDVGAQVFVLGTDEQTDRVMVLKLMDPAEA